MKKVFVNGCFDVLHVGHIRLLEFAKSHGDCLIVALDTDEKVKNAKGINRPFNNLETRKEVMSSIKYVDLVLDFSSDEELVTLLNIIKPDTRILGSDWEGKPIVGEGCVRDLKYFRRVNGFSTTKILESSSGR
tara:strand:+ start:1417 stop:1815 length:399 start_codon:yes stop_codon:yes gene_type:complete